MSIITKIKQAVEKWLRGIVADEVSKIDTDLQREKVALRSQVMVFDEAFKTQLQDFNQAVEHLIEVSNHSQENIELKNTISKLVAHSSEVIDTFNKLHPVVK